MPNEASMSHRRPAGLALSVLALAPPVMSPAKAAPAEERLYGGLYSKACHDVRGLRGCGSSAMS
jgi:hypothetical protein